MEFNPIDIFLHLDIYLAQLVDSYGIWVYGILFAVIFCETGLVVTPFLPGDSLLFVAGTIAATGGMELPVLIVCLMTAAILGDSSNYFIGRFIGEKLFANPQSKIFSPRLSRTDPCLLRPAWRQDRDDGALRPRSSAPSPPSVARGRRDALSPLSRLQRLWHRALGRRADDSRLPVRQCRIHQEKSVGRADRHRRLSFMPAGIEYLRARLAPGQGNSGGSSPEHGRCAWTGNCS